MCLLPVQQRRVILQLRARMRRAIVQTAFHQHGCCVPARAPPPKRGGPVYCSAGSPASMRRLCASRYGQWGDEGCRGRGRGSRWCKRVWRCRARSAGVGTGMSMGMTTRSRLQASETVDSYDQRFKRSAVFVRWRMACLLARKGRVWEKRCAMQRDRRRDRGVRWAPSPFTATRTPGPVQPPTGDRIQSIQSSRKQRRATGLARRA